MCSTSLATLIATSAAALSEASMRGMFVDIGSRIFSNVSLFILLSFISFILLLIIFFTYRISLPSILRRNLARLSLFVNSLEVSKLNLIRPHFFTEVLTDQL